MLIKSIGSRECFPAGFTHSANGVQQSFSSKDVCHEVRRDTSTKNEEEIQKQEIKNLKTFYISKMDKATAKENLFHFFSRHPSHLRHPSQAEHPHRPRHPSHPRHPMWPHPGGHTQLG